MKQQHEPSVTRILRDYALKKDGNEIGDENHCFIAVAIDKRRGSATDYVAKYISKNIDGFGMESDLYGISNITAIERVTVLASILSIRQFQFMDGPPASHCRELKRLDLTKENTYQLGKTAEYNSKGTDGAQDRIRGNSYNIPQDTSPSKQKLLVVFKFGRFSDVVEVSIKAEKRNGLTLMVSVIYTSANGEKSEMS